MGDPAAPRQVRAPHYSRVGRLGDGVRDSRRQCRQGLGFFGFLYWVSWVSVFFKLHFCPEAAWMPINEVFFIMKQKVEIKLSCEAWGVITMFLILWPFEKWSQQDHLNNFYYEGNNRDWNTKRLTRRTTTTSTIATTNVYCINYNDYENKYNVYDNNYSFYNNIYNVYV